MGGEEGIETVDGTPRVYIETLEPNNDREFTYTLKAKEVGTYNVSSELSYEYNNGIDAENLKGSNKSTTSSINVKEGKFDFLIKNPLYIIISVLILAAAGSPYIQETQGVQVLNGIRQVLSGE